MIRATHQLVTKVRIMMMYYDKVERYGHANPEVDCDSVYIVIAGGSVRRHWSKMEILVAVWWGVRLIYPSFRQNRYCSI